MRSFVAWPIPSSCPRKSVDLDAARLVSTPSRAEPGLARDCHRKRELAEGFPDFEPFYIPSFQGCTQFLV